MGMSNWFELKPAKSQPLNFVASEAAILLNEGASATSASVMPVSCCTNGGMGFPGFTKMFSRFSSPDGITFI